MGRIVVGLICTAAALLIASPARADDVSGSKDHPSISRFKGADIIGYGVRDFDEAVLPVKPVNARAPLPPASTLKVEGRVTNIMYRLPPGKTALEAMRNYEQALASYKVIFRCAGDECGQEMVSYVADQVVPAGWGGTTFNNSGNRYLAMQRSGPEGDVVVAIYAMQEANSNPVTVFQKVIQIKPMQTGQVTVLDAATLGKGLDAEGRVAVYGIYFDTGKADVKAESKPSLDEMAKLLSTRPAIKVYIVGHTDNAGTLAANSELSQRRAEAVVKALAGTYRIDPARLVARGVASLSPVAHNTDEAGRARNRRVELVLQ